MKEARIHRRALQAAAARITHASVPVSFDGGRTWHAALVAGHDGGYAATFTAARI